MTTTWKLKLILVFWKYQLNKKNWCSLVNKQTKCSWDEITQFSEPILSGTDVTWWIRSLVILLKLRMITFKKWLFVLATTLQWCCCYLMRLSFQSFNWYDKVFLYDELLESQIFFSWLIIYNNCLPLEGFPNHRLWL